MLQGRPLSSLVIALYKRVSIVPITEQVTALVIASIVIFLLSFASVFGLALIHPNDFLSLAKIASVYIFLGVGGELLVF